MNLYGRIVPLKDDDWSQFNDFVAKLKSELATRSSFVNQTPAATLRNMDPAGNPSHHLITLEQERSSEQNAHGLPTLRVEIHMVSEIPEPALRRIAAHYDEVQFAWEQMCEVVAYNDPTGHCLIADPNYSAATASWYEHNEWPPIGHEA